MRKKRYYLSLVIIALYFLLNQHQMIYAEEINELDYRRLIYINENGGSGASAKWMYTIDSGGENDWETAGSWWNGLGAGGKYIDSTGNWHIIQDFSNSYTNQIQIGEMFFQRVDCVGITPRLLLSTPSRYGYDFAGWTIDNGRTGEAHDGYTAFNVGCYAGNNLTFTAQWTPWENPTPIQRFPIDLNSYLDNEQHWDLSSFGTADVYINEIKVADDVEDYCQTDFLTGTTYMINDIKAKPGYAYTGPTFFSGTLTDNGAWLWPTFVTLVTFDVNAYFNGIEQGYLSPWGTADVYINGNKVVEDGADYYNVNLSKGSNFLVNDIKANFGYDYTGPASFSGTLTAPYTSVALPFQLSTFTIQFDANGGQGSMNSIVLNSTLLENLPSNTFTKATTSGQSKFIGWSKDKNATVASYKENGKFTFTSGESIITLFAIWDDCPVITAKDRYYTLYEAKNGIITQANLLTTVTATDDKDSNIVQNLKVADFNPNEFIQFTSKGSSLVKYQVTDSASNTSSVTATVYIVDTDDSKKGDIDSDGTKTYVRSIGKKYLMADAENGGLEETSVWRTDSQYNILLVEILNNTKKEDGKWGSMAQTWEFTSQNVEKVKEYIGRSGIGNAKHEDSLDRFLTIYNFCKK
ncbi:InlB B-repeat-containing protein [[Clostridium] fimetarium]|uniref:Listeria/Bacterioides repeat-containing protein n=1 Tax=[Clostridium] fimetarium TaxID=99656 RepID=A0A1I0NJ39_9FIRM|nr:InlB B-repeat-containing protein [[Clostridium] fimetarium]SEW00874.1 Listeria/Bacterioides repeat-containing protein [[Clostridium] fimetarium]